jgi:hypothetical protein
MTRMLRSAAAISLAALLLLTGCGSGSSTTAGDATSGPTSGVPSGSAYTTAQLHNYRECLKAAGLPRVYWSPSPGDGMSGSPAGTPSEAPSTWTGGPVGFPTGAKFSDQKIAKALRICRITLPSIAPSN